MARNSTIVQLDTRVLDAMIRNLDGNVAEAVAKTAFAVEARAKILAPVDTGALRASIYTALKGEERFNQARSDAASRRPNVAIAPLPVPRDGHTAYVGPSVEYGEIVHNGSSTMAGRPFLAQAVRDAERDLRRHLGEAVQP
jgi:hypothetical protein